MDTALAKVRRKAQRVQDHACFSLLRHAPVAASVHTTVIQVNTVADVSHNRPPSESPLTKNVHDGPSDQVRMRDRRRHDVQPDQRAKLRNLVSSSARVAQTDITAAQLDSLEEGEERATHSNPSTLLVHQCQVPNVNVPSAMRTLTTYMPGMMGWLSELSKTSRKAAKAGKKRYVAWLPSHR